MSTSIIELNGTHLGKKVTIADAGIGITISGVLFEVSHNAPRNSHHVNLGGRSDITLSSWATFTVDA